MASIGGSWAFRAVAPPARKAQPDGRGDRRAGQNAELASSRAKRSANHGPRAEYRDDSSRYDCLPSYKADNAEKAGKPKAAARAVAPRCSFPSQRNHCRERVSSRQSTSSCPAIPIGGVCADGTEWRRAGCPARTGSARWEFQTAHPGKKAGMGHLPASFVAAVAPDVRAS